MLLLCTVCLGCCVLLDCAVLMADPPILPCPGCRLLPRRQRFAPSSGQREMQQWQQRRPTMGACRLCQVGAMLVVCLTLLWRWWKARYMHACFYTHPFACLFPGCHSVHCVAMQALPICGAHPARTCFPTWVRVGCRPAQLPLSLCWVVVGQQPDGWAISSTNAQCKLLTNP